MQKKRLNLTTFIFLAPALFFYICFVIAPTVGALLFSFTEWAGMGTPKFIGLQNYRELLLSDSYWASLKNVALILFGGGAIIIVLALALTGLLAPGVKGRMLFRAIYFVPVIIPQVVLSIIWAYIYNPTFGLLNQTLGLIGLEKLQLAWTGPHLIFPSVLASLVWMNTGLYTVILMSGVDKIPADYWDYAKVEGAGKAQTFMRVTLPLMWDVFAIAVTLWGIWTIRLFEFIYSFSANQVRTELYTVSILVYLRAFGEWMSASYRFGFGSAIAVTQLFIVVFFILASRRVLWRERIEY